MASEAVPKAYRIAAAPFVVVSAILLYFTLVTPSAAWLHAALLADVAGILALALLAWRSAHHAKPPGLGGSVTLREGTMLHLSGRAA